MRVYNIVPPVKGQIRTTTDYGQAVVDAHRLGAGTRIFSVGPYNNGLAYKCIKVIGFTYPVKG